MTDEKPTAGTTLLARIKAALSWMQDETNADARRHMGALRDFERLSTHLAATEADVERLREALSLIGNIVGDEKEIVVVLKAPYPDLIRAALAETEPR